MSHLFSFAFILRSSLHPSQCRNGTDDGGSDCAFHVAVAVCHLFFSSNLRILGSCTCGINSVCACIRAARGIMFVACAKAGFDRARVSVIARGRHCVKSSLFLPCARFSSDAKKKLSTVDIEEVQKFSDAAADWWGNKDAGNTNAVGPLHKMNPVRVNYICRRVRERFGNDGSSPLSGLRVLDVGCGGGILSESLARLGASVTGIDASLPSIDAARKHSGLNASTKSVEYFHSTVEEFSALVQEGAGDEMKFDIVCALEIIEHVADPLHFLTECSNVVRTDGCMFVSTLNRTSRSFLLGIIMAEEVLKLVPSGTHDWKKFLKPEELQEYAREVRTKDAAASLDMVDLVGLQLNPLNHTWYEHANDVAVNYIAEFELRH